MANAIKRLIHPIVPTTGSIAYTVPQGKYTVVKSIVITNSNSPDLTYYLKIGGTFIAVNRTLKGKNTLIIDDLFIPLLPSETITVQASNSGCVMYISGVEKDYIESEYPYTTINAVTSTSPVNLPSRTTDVMIKSIIIHNLSTNVVPEVTVYIPWSFINQMKLNTKDTLIIPNLNVLLPSNHNLTYYATNNVYFTVILERVVQ
ncbi:hypothetical protein MKY66_06395 [Paenibacillus sp. FSL R5-0766]|uniref:hypothetical protein n=1 Tax=unclassified Paenibacillus TaxID=185978 RepID=UPI00096F9570|nr:hypothetical protein [Paenibacillus sp. FSL R5-0765]OMF66311.1 hypothetical protein BK141_05130 [Paenibacillus sp. FSL R5-0765]